MIIILIARHGDRESLALFLIPAWQEIERSALNGDRLIPEQMQMLKLTSSYSMARKSKGFGEILNQQRADKTHQKGLEKLQQKVQKGPLGDKFSGMVTNPKGEVKMSEVLEEFAEPYLDFAQNRSQREKLFSIAVIAWNLAIMPENERQPMIDQLIKVGLKGNDPLAQQDTREIIDELIARKQKFFAKNERYIVDFQLQDTGKQFHLSVASTLSNPLVAD